MVATHKGATPAVAADIARLGGQIKARFDDAGYLYALLPIERLQEVTALPDVLMAHLDGGAPGGSYALDRDLVYSAASMWSSSNFTLPNTLLGVWAEPPGASPSAAAREARLDTPASNPLSLGIEQLLRDASSALTEAITENGGEGRFPAGGQDIYALMANRTVELSGKPIFVPTGDGARVDSISGAAAGRRVLAIRRVNADGDREGKLPVRASKGPASDGGAKPDLLGSATEATELVAAARAENLPADARHIAWALRMSARRLDGYQAHEQGFGLIDLERAKELLRQVKSRRFELPDILTRAPVKTFLARFLPEAGTGQGLYEREGWLLKRAERRKITLLRQNGSPTPLTYTLQWQGNDGTFKARQDEVILPFDTPVEVEIEITPAQVGIHSAHLYLIDKASQLPVHAVMATIVASEQFTAANGYTIRHGDQPLDRSRSTSYFLEVPPNVASLRVDVAAKAGQAEMLLGIGGPIDVSVNLPRAGRPIVPGKPALVLVPYPAAGVYELTLLPSGQGNARVDVSASIHYIDSQLDEAPPENNGTKLWLNNIYAPIQRSSVLAEVGARRTLEDVGGPTGMRAYNITVPADSTTLRVAASPPDGRARLGLYLYECVDGTCNLWGSDVFTKTTDKLLIVPKPRGGLWRVVVDAGAAGTAFKYSELITHPRFGSGTAEGVDEPRRTGARWNQTVSYQVQEPVPFGYEAVGVMDVVDTESEAQERAARYGDARMEPLRPLRLTTQVFKLSRPNR